MIPWDLRLIRELRIKLGLTQSQLARLAGVSQSLIAKIERGTVNPSYDAVRRIFLALERVRVQRGMDIRAGEVCTRRILYVSVNDTVEKAAEIMRRNDVSQLPVFKGDRPVGSISESTIVRSLGKISPSTRVSEVMEECFPIVPEDASISLVRQILMEYQAVLTQKNGRITGIITRADLLKVLGRVREES